MAPRLYHAGVWLLVMVIAVALGCSSTTATQQNGTDGSEVTSTDLESDADTTTPYPTAPPDDLPLYTKGLPDHEWLVTLCGEEAERVVTMTTDIHGAIVFGGTTTSAEVTFGAITGVSSITDESDGKSDGYIARLSSDGEPFWLRFIGTTERYDEVTAVTTGDDGTVYAAGIVDDGKELIFAGQPVDPIGQTFLAAYDDAGTELWIETCELGRPTSLAILNDGAIAVTGYIDTKYDTCVKEGSPDDYHNYHDIMVTVFEPDGTVRWSNRFGGKLVDQGVGSVPGPLGGVVILARYRSYDLDFGGGWLTVEDSTDVALAGLLADGTHSWSSGFGGDLSEVPTMIATTDEGFIVGGQFAGDALDFGLGPLSALEDNDIFLGSFSHGGDPSWSISIGGDGYETVVDATQSSHGTTYVLIEYQSTWLDLGTGALVNHQPPNPTNALLEIDGTGTIVDARQWGTPIMASAHQEIEVATDGSFIFGHVWHSGNGPSPLAPEIEGMGGEDVVIAKLHL